MTFEHEVPQTDFSSIVIVGGGLAGTAAAAVLGRQGHSVTLVDARMSCPAVFKAEKIEPEQAELLRKLGLLDFATSSAARIREIHSSYKGKLFGTVQAEQYGAYYADMVDGLRASLPETVRFKVGRVTDITNSANLQHVRLASGEELTSRLVVLACGLNAELPTSLGLKRVSIRKHHSVALAFTIARPDGDAFPFDSVTCYPRSTDMGIDYLTFFLIGQAMRANLFAFPGAGDRWVRQFVQEPDRELHRYFPRLRQAIGPHRVISKVETSLIHLYRTEGEIPPGVVMIGDAAQNACPSTGMGLSKVFTDVDVLCTECVPRWLATPGMGSEKLASYWNDPGKRAVDAEALDSANYRRRARTDSSLRWMIHRARLNFGMQLGWLREFIAEAIHAKMLTRR